MAADVAALLAEHRDCGELATGLVGTPPRVWLTCSCGARLERAADEAPR